MQWATSQWCSYRSLSLPKTRSWCSLSISICHSQLKVSRWCNAKGEAASMQRCDRRSKMCGCKWPSIISHLQEATSNREFCYPTDAKWTRTIMAAIRDLEQAIKVRPHARLNKDWSSRLGLQIRLSLCRRLVAKVSHSRKRGKTSSSVFKSSSQVDRLQDRDASNQRATLWE